MERERGAAPTAISIDAGGRRGATVISEVPRQTGGESLECCLAVVRWWRGGLVVVIGGCVWGGEGRLSGCSVFCLASPETISHAGRFVLAAG